MEAPLLWAESVTHRFGEVEALSNLNLNLTGGTIGLVGPNGSGKTTLIRLMLGLLVPTSGRLAVLGTDPQLEPLKVREQVGYMPEHDCLMPDLSGVGFVAYMGRVSGMPADVAMSRAHDVLEFVGLREERYRRIREYSVGMRQRVKLAQAIVHDPPLCFLDEPTSGLDPKGREEMLGLVRALARLGRHSFVISTHLLPDVEGLCDQVLLLNAGRSLAAGPVRELLAVRDAEIVLRVKGDPNPFLKSLARRGLAPRVVGHEIRLPNSADGPLQVFQAAFETHTQVRQLGSAVATVEDLFLMLVNTPSGSATP